MVRSDAVFAFSSPAPPTATESDCLLDALEELCNLVSFTGRHADRTTDLAEIRVVGMQNRHLPTLPSVFRFRHDYLLPIQLSELIRVITLWFTGREMRVVLCETACKTYFSSLAKAKPIPKNIRSTPEIRLI